MTNGTISGRGGLQELGQTRTGPASCRIEFLVPHELACLEGHFPDLPIVPGVALLGWAERCARERLGADGEVRRVERLKFNRLVRPGETVALDLDWERADGDETCRFRWTRQGHEVASGRLFFTRGTAT